MSTCTRSVVFASLIFWGWIGLPALGQSPPSISSISPAQGPVAGGTAVTISGSGFTQNTAVSFNRNAGINLQFVDASHLQVTTPPLGSGPFATALAAVRISNVSGATFGEFLYQPPSFQEIGIGDITTIAGVGNFIGEGRMAPEALVEAEGIAVDAAGNLYMGEETGGRVRKIGSDGRIITIAGTGAIGFSGDGGPATEAQFNWPAGVAVDRAGNVYVADAFGNNRVRRIDGSSGIVKTIAGTGHAGYSGDGGPATQAQLNTPNASIAVDAQGNVYVVDAGNARVRKIDTRGVITTVAGNGAPGFSGDGGPATQASFNLDGQLGTLALDSTGNIYVVDFGNQRIRRIGTDGRVSTVVGGGNMPPADGAVATQTASIFNCVAVDPQDRLIFTEGAHVWRLEKSGFLTGVAGNGTPGLAPDGVAALTASIVPLNIAVAPNGDIFVSERAARRIRRISAATGVLTTAAGIGPRAIGDQGSSALAAAFLDIGNLAIDGNGNILVVEPRGSLRIRELGSTGIVTVAGIGVEPVQGFYHEGVPAVSAGMSPVSVGAVGDGTIVFTDFCSVRSIGTDGLVRTIVGPVTNSQSCGFAGDGGAGTGALLAAEQDVLKVDGQRNIFIADVFNHRVRKLDATTGIITTFAGSGPATSPGGYDVTHAGGGFAGDGGAAGQALLMAPTDVAFDSRRNICIADIGNFSVRCVDVQGVIRTVAGRGSNYPGDGGAGTSATLNPYRLAFDRAGNMYISDIADGTIRKLDANGILTTVAGVHGSHGFSGDGGSALAANIDYGSGLAVDAQGNVLFFDGENRRIRIIKEAVTFGGSSIAANAPGPLSGLWWNPSESGWGIAFTQRRNNVFAAWYTYDTSGNAVWYVASNCALPSGVTGMTGVCTGSLYHVNGPTFFGSAFNSALVNVAAAGNLQVNFTDANNATMTYTVAGQSRTVPIVRQIFASGTTAPAVDYTDLWWNPNESGWGLEVIQQFNNIFLAWYVYDGNGNPTWYVASNCTVTGSGCSGTLYRTAGPAFGPIFNPAQVQVFTAGTVSLNFSDPNNGTLSYTVNGVAGSKVITRQLF